MSRKKALTAKEKMFCVYFALLRDGRDAAARAGYHRSAEKSAALLLGRAEVLSEIEKLEENRKTSSEEVAAGYRRLAFGSVADALRLVCTDEMLPQEEIEKMDLFNVSDIKRPKGGGIEIKFFDRLKALEKLGEISSRSAAAGSLPFYEALDKGARAITGREANE